MCLSFYYKFVVFIICYYCATIEAALAIVKVQALVLAQVVM